MFTQMRQFPVSRRAAITNNAEFELLISRVGSLKGAKKAIFLDRDGTINYDRGYINNPGDVTLLPMAAEAVRTLNSLGLSVVVATNQSALDRGILLETELEQVNRKLWNLLQEFDAYYDALYYCPHDPTALPGCLCSPDHS